MDRRKFIFTFSGCLLAVRHLPVIAATTPVSVEPVTGFVYDPVFLEHLMSPDHPESPARLNEVMKVMQNRGLMDKLARISLKSDIKHHIKQLHSDEHIKALQDHHAISEKTATAVVEGVLAAVDKVCQGELKNAFCAVRPPGHHALNTGKIEGFCLYNTIAIAARYAKKIVDLKKILIVDWDYHHGNATEAMFYEDPEVLYFSTHDLYAYPGTGHPDKKGKGRGLGYNINVHLGCGTTDAQIIDAFTRILVPAANQFKPDLILISAGFDSRKDDLLGCFDITDQGYIKLTEIVMQLAERHCSGKIVSMLEGGYNLKGNASAVAAHVSTLMNIQ